jgi:hypothetical protein
MGNLRYLKNSKIDRSMTSVTIKPQDWNGVVWL